MKITDNTLIKQSVFSVDNTKMKRGWGTFLFLNFIKIKQR